MINPFTITSMPNVAMVRCNACKDDITVYGTDRQAKHKVSQFYKAHQHAHTTPDTEART